MANLLYFDVETTGLFYWQHGIHQLSGAIEVDGVIKEYFNYKVQPADYALIDDKALAISGVSRKDLKSYMPIKECFDSLIEKLYRYGSPYKPEGRYYLVGYNNAYFDNQFLRYFFSANKTDSFTSWFWIDTRDCMVLASTYLESVRCEMKNFKQSTVAKWLGIPVDMERLHDAEYDVSLLIQIYKIVTKKPEDNDYFLS